MVNVCKDDRVTEARQIISTFVTSRYYEFTMAYIRDNILAFVVHKTTLFITTLNTVASVGSEQEIGFIYENIVDYEDPSCYISDYNIIINMRAKLATYSNLESRFPVIFMDEDMRANPEFESLLSLKSDDGLKFLKIPTTIGVACFPMFSGLINANKQDKIGLIVHDQLDNHLINRVVIYKKKINRTVDMYFRTLKV